MKYFIILFVFIFSYSTFSSCPTTGLRALIKSSEKLRANFVSEIDKVLKEKVTKEELVEIFRKLKEEEERYLDSYLNRSKRKTKLTQEEESKIRENLKIPLKYNSPQVQTAYSNELKRLIILVESKYRGFLADEITKDLEASYPRTLKKLIKAILLAKNLSKAIDTVGANKAVSGLLNYKGIPEADLEIIFSAADSEVPDFDLLRSTNFRYKIRQIKDIYKREQSEFCCFSSPGCEVCPYNRFFHYR